jgi:hypothetical protein
MVQSFPKMFLVVIGLAIPFVAGMPSSLEARQHSYFRPCVKEGQPPPFVNYFLGQSFDGYPLTVSDYYCAPPYVASTGPPGRDDDVTFGYSDCNVPGHAGHCAPQVIVRSTPACDENYFLTRFELLGRTSRLPRLTTLRGAPALVISVTAQLSLYTDDATINVYGQSVDQIKRAVDALQPGPQSAEGAAPGAPLPPPVSGALDGSLRCGLSFSHLGIVDRDYLQLRLPRAARVNGWIQKRPLRGRKPTTHLNFQARRGTTKHRLHLHAGRYRATLMAEDRQGRHTSARVIDFLVKR